jgi:hypothetical protein
LHHHPAAGRLLADPQGIEADPGPGCFRVQHKGLGAGRKKRPANAATSRPKLEKTFRETLDRSGTEKVRWVWSLQGLG